MKREEIINMSDIEFEPILKACLIRLQEDKQYGNVIMVKHDGSDEYSIIVPYIDNDTAEPLHIGWEEKNFYVNNSCVEIDNIIT